MGGWGGREGGREGEEIWKYGPPTGGALCQSKWVRMGPTGCNWTQLINFNVYLMMQHLMDELNQFDWINRTGFGELEGRQWRRERQERQDLSGLNLPVVSAVDAEVQEAH